MLGAGTSAAVGRSPGALLSRRRSASRPFSRRRSWSDSARLRSRMDFGVTSTSSSAAIISMADSSVMGGGGVRRSDSSWLWVRMLVSFFSLVALTSMSPDREFSPTIMPS